MTFSEKKYKKNIICGFKAWKMSQNLTYIKNFQTKIFIFEYFQKKSLEINSTHHCYPILIPNTSFVILLFLYMYWGRKGPENQKNIRIYKNYFN